MKTFSFFEVDQKYTFAILSGFKGIEYNRREVIVQVSQGDEHPKSERPPKRERTQRTKPAKKKKAKRL
jgi:hypothetical protein